MEGGQGTRWGRNKLTYGGSLKGVASVPRHPVDKGREDQSPRLSLQVKYGGGKIMDVGFTSVDGP